MTTSEKMRLRISHESYPKSGLSFDLTKCNASDLRPPQINKILKSYHVSSEYPVADINDGAVDGHDTDASQTDIENVSPRSVGADRPKGSTSISPLYRTLLQKAPSFGSFFVIFLSIL